MQCLIAAAAFARLIARAKVKAAERAAQQAAERAAQQAAAVVVKIAAQSANHNTHNTHSIHNTHKLQESSEATTEVWPPRDSTPIMRMHAHEFDEQVFKEEYLSKGRPVVITGGVGVGEWKGGQHWSLLRLKEQFGERSVLVRKETACDKYRLGQHKPVERMRFERYIKHIEEPAAGAERGGMYLAAANMRHTFPELRAHLPAIVDRLFAPVRAV